MKHFILYFVAGCILLIGSYPVMSGFAPTGQIPGGIGLNDNNAGFAEKCAVNLEIHWSEFTPLVFSGIPGQTQTGEVAYLIHTGLKCREALVEITGTAFSNGGIFLETQYRAGNCPNWYQAGTSFVMKSIPGKESKIKYQATTGPKTSSQRAGAYTAKLSISVISLK